MFQCSNSFYIVSNFLNVFWSCLDRVYLERINGPVTIIDNILNNNLFLLSGHTKSTIVHKSAYIRFFNKEDFIYNNIEKNWTLDEFQLKVQQSQRLKQLPVLIYCSRKER